VIQLLRLKCGLECAIINDLDSLCLKILDNIAIRLHMNQKAAWTVMLIEELKL